MSEFAVQEIRSQIASFTGADPLRSPIPHLGSTAEFDAFGEVYQSAITLRDRNGGLPGTTSAGMVGGDRSIATPSGTVFPMTPGIASAALLQPMTGVDQATLTAAITGQAGLPGPRQVGGYGPMPVPASLEAFGNGRIPTEALTPLSGQSNHRLYAPAAASWNNLVAAARADGIELRITDSYRSYEEQVDLVRRKGLYSEGGLAARPGTSNHGWGLTVDADVTDRATYDWLARNGPRFGWVEAVPREPWHWEFRPNQV